MIFIYTRCDIFTSMELKINSMTKLAMILALNKAPMHGYALMDQVESSTGARPGPAQIYPFLAKLSAKKLVEASKKGVRDKTSYSLTPAGKDFVEGLLSKMGSLLEGALGGKITQCTHCSCKIFGKPFVRKVRGHEYGFCCPHCADNFLASGSKK